MRDIVRCGWATWTNTPLIPAEDLTWLATWSNVEITVGITIACLPSARLLILRYLPNKIKSWTETTRATRSSHTTRSSKLGSTATWVSGLSGKRESDARDWESDEEEKARKRMRPDEEHPRRDAEHDDEMEYEEEEDEETRREKQRLRDLEERDAFAERCSTVLQIRAQLLW